MGIIEIGKGMNIYSAIDFAKSELRKKSLKDGKFLFNEVVVPFSHISEPTDIAIIYSLMLENKRLNK